MPSWLVAAVLTIASGVALALLGRLVWELYAVKWLARVRAWLHSRRRVEYDARRDHMYAINTWSPERPLRPRNLDVALTTERPPLRWVDPTRWRQHYDESRESYAGSCGYVTFVGPVDFREGPTTEVFRVTLSPCDYAEGLATWKALRDDEDKQRAIADALSADPFAFARTSPPNPLAINVAILSPSGRFLAVERSASVASSQGVWTIGPNEMLTLHDDRSPADRTEDFFSLAQRCLREEVGLSLGDYGDVSISWFGYRSADAHPWIFAQVRSKLSESEVGERLREAHSSVEAASTEWLPLTRETVRRIVDSERNHVDSFVERNRGGRRWIAHAPLAVTELWRMQSRL
jgi:hypothetical protein